MNKWNTRLSKHFAWTHNNLSVSLKLKIGSYYFIWSANQMSLKAVYYFKRDA